MVTLTMPATPNISRARWGLLANTRTFSSSFNRAAQTQELVGAIWTATYTLPRMKLTEADAWTAFLAQLLGGSGRFFGFDPRKATPRGSVLGTPLVKGASQTGKSLITDGWNTGETGLLLVGDYFQIGTELKMVTASVDSDSAGDATISFIPSLRASPADNAALILTNTNCIMRLINDDQSIWEQDPIFYGITFSGIEHIGT